MLLVILCYWLGYLARCCIEKWLLLLFTACRVLVAQHSTGINSELCQFCWKPSSVIKTTELWWIFPEDRLCQLANGTLVKWQTALLSNAFDWVCKSLAFRWSCLRGTKPPDVFDITAPWFLFFSFPAAAEHQKWTHKCPTTLTNTLGWNEARSSSLNGRIISNLDVLWPSSIWIRQGNREWAGLLLQPSASLPSFFKMIYSHTLRPDLIFQPHARCASSGEAFTINKQTLFTWIILREAMRLKHLQPGIHLPHTSKHHPDSIDISLAEETAAVDGCRTGAHLVTKGMEEMSDEGEWEGRRKFGLINEKWELGGGGAWSEANQEAPHQTSVLLVHRGDRRRLILSGNCCLPFF